MPWLFWQYVANAFLSLEATVRELLTDYESRFLERSLPVTYKPPLAEGSTAASG
jgi:hypothetical protein